MSVRRKVEVFSAGCCVCEEAIELINSIACPCCEISVLDMQDEDIKTRAKDLGIRSVPAVVVNGKLAACCGNGGPDENTLRAEGIGQPL